MRRRRKRRAEAARRGEPLCRDRGPIHVWALTRQVHLREIDELLRPSVEDRFEHEHPELVRLVQARRRRHRNGVSRECGHRGRISLSPEKGAAPVEVTRVQDNIRHLDPHKELAR